MEQVTTYTVKAKNTPDVWVFKYHLNGVLFQFTVLEGLLSQPQLKWLFGQNNFPYSEAHIKQWQANLKKNFDIAVGMPDTSFEAFWQAYGHRVRKVQSQKEWKKLKEADRLKAFDGIRRYNNHLRLNTWKGKMDPNRFLKEQRWEDEF